MRKIINTFTLLFAYLALHSQSKIYTGYISNKENNEPVANAYVFIDVTPKIGTITNEKGYFRLVYDGTDTSALELIISHIVYEEARYSLSEQDKTTMDMKIAISPRSFNLDEMTVTSLAADQIVERMVYNLDKNHAVDPVAYQFFCRTISAHSKDSTIHVMQEYNGIMKTNTSHDSHFYFQRNRVGAFTEEGKEACKQERIMASTKMYIDVLHKFKEDYLENHKRKHFQFLLKGVSNLQGKSCYEIYFSGNDKADVKQGLLYITLNDYALLRAVHLDEENRIQKEVVFTEINKKYYLFYAIEFHQRYKSDLFDFRQTLYQVRSSLTIPTDYREASSVSKIQNMTNVFSNEYWADENSVDLPLWVKKRLNL